MSRQDTHQCAVLSPPEAGRTVRSSEEEKRVNWIEKAERRYSTVTVSEYSVLAWTGGTGAVLTVETVVKRARYHGFSASRFTDETYCRVGVCGLLS